MKKAIFTLLGTLMILAFVNQTFAQVPQGFNYQAVARSIGGALITNQSLGVMLTIHQGSAGGTVVYSERQTPTTNLFGLFTVTVGQGTFLSGSAFNTINWSSGNYWLEVGLDVSGGTTYSSMGSSQLLTVPYAMYASSSSTAWNDITGKPNFATVATSGSYNDLINKLTAGSGITINGSNVISTNMTLSVSNAGDTLHLNPGNYVIIPGISSVNSSQPHVTTNVITTITATTAICGYTVTMTGLPVITKRGVCWGTQTLPDTLGYHTYDGGGTGSFQSNLTGLSPNTIYHVRAYAVNANGLYYGAELDFTTSITCPTVTTSDTTYVGTTTATCGGDVIDNGGANVTGKGVCWSTSQNPTYSNSHTSDGTLNGPFTSNMTGLSSNTLYYYRAYATNNNGVSYCYGIQKSFTTDCTPPIVLTDTIFSSGCTSAIIQCHIPSAGCASVTERGICWGTMSLPDIYGYGTKVSNGSGTGGFNFTLNTLVPNTTYRVRSYAISNSVVTYGAIKTFSVPASYYAGFETGMPTGWTGMWAVSTDSPYEGSYCLKSVNVPDSVQFTRTINVAGQISFFHSGDDGYGGSYQSHTLFYIDNILQGNFGDEGWTIHTYPVTAGTHTFKWKNNGGGMYYNRVYIDYIIICP